MEDIETAWKDVGVAVNHKKDVNGMLGEEVQGAWVDPVGHWVGVSVPKRMLLIESGITLLSFKCVRKRLLQCTIF